MEEKIPQFPAMPTRRIHMKGSRTFLSQHRIMEADGILRIDILVIDRDSYVRRRRLAGNM
jgi:hypothetical protein